MATISKVELQNALEQYITEDQRHLNWCTKLYCILDGKIELITHTPTDVSIEYEISKCTVIRAQKKLAKLRDLYVAGE